ncbi:KAP family P-loop domain protein [compost metagenome]
MISTNFGMDWDWSKDIEISIDGEKETLPTDKLERRRYAEYLYFYLNEKGKENNTVINLNAEWGAGKTFFIKRMYSSIKETHPCIYIDAWKQDFSDDAFLTLFSSIINQIEKYSGVLDVRLIKSLSSIGRFTKGVIPAILSGLVKEYGGIDSVSDISKTAAELMLSEHKEKSEAIVKLKKELTFWGNLSFKKGYKSPIFIFIDELDRCKPSYAVSLLEIVKHIFNIDKFVFIIATDTNQLQHSIKNVYGSGFGAHDYLGRFFHRRFSLKAPDIHEVIKNIIEDELNEEFEELTINLIPKPSNIEQLSKNISEIFNAFSLNLRDSIRNTERFIDLIQSKSFKKKIDYLALITLMVMYDKDHDLMQKILGLVVGNNTIDKLIHESKSIKSFPLAKLSLTLDCSKENIGLDYFKINHNATRTNNLQIENAKVDAKEYMKNFISFMTSHQSLRQTLKNSGQNTYFTFKNAPLEIEKVGMHYGALIEEREHPIEIYSLDGYLNFIELASSFE